MKLQVGALPGQLLFGATIGNAPPAQRARPVDTGYLAVGKKNFVGSRFVRRMINAKSSNCGDVLAE